MKSMIKPVLVALAAVVFSSCTFTTIVVDHTVTNGTSSLRPVYSGNGVSGLEQGDAIVFYKGDADKDYKKAAASALDVSIARLVQVRIGLDDLAFSSINLSKTVGIGSYRYPGYNFFIKDKNQNVASDMDYYIGFHNTGTLAVKDMVFVDYLPDEFTPKSIETLQPGSYLLSMLFSWTMIPLFTQDFMLDVMDDTWAPLKGDSVSWEIKPLEGKRAVVVKISDPAGVPVGKAWMIRIKGHFDYPALKH